jgi:hypothetical protein
MQPRTSAQYCACRSFEKQERILCLRRHSRDGCAVPCTGEVTGTIATFELQKEYFAQKVPSPAARPTKTKLGVTPSAIPNSRRGKVCCVNAGAAGPVMVGITCGPASSSCRRNQGAGSDKSVSQPSPGEAPLLLSLLVHSRSEATPSAPATAQSQSSTASRPPRFGKRSYAAASAVPVDAPG